MEDKVDVSQGGLEGQGTGVCGGKGSAVNGHHTFTSSGGSNVNLQNSTFNPSTPSGSSEVVI